MKRVFHHTPESKQQSLHSHDDGEVQEEVMTWFKGQAADFYDSQDTEAGSKT